MVWPAFCAPATASFSRMSLAELHSLSSLHLASKLRAALYAKDEIMCKGRTQHLLGFRVLGLWR